MQTSKEIIRLRRPQLAHVAQRPGRQTHPTLETLRQPAPCPPGAALARVSALRISAPAASTAQGAPWAGWTRAPIITPSSETSQASARQAPAHEHGAGHAVDVGGRGHAGPGRRLKRGAEARRGRAARLKRVARAGHNARRLRRVETLGTLTACSMRRVETLGTLTACSMRRHSCARST